MKDGGISRRELVRGAGSLVAASVLLVGAAAEEPTKRSVTQKLRLPAAAGSLPVRLGIATYTFRQFDAAHLMEFGHELRVPFLDLHETHLPMRSPAEVAAQAAAYRTAGFTLSAVGTVQLDKPDDADMRAKFEYCKAAGVSTMVCAPSRETLPRLSRFVREYGVRLAIHNHGPEDRNFPSPFDVLAAVKGMDERIGLCIDLGHALRAGADVVEAVHAAGPRLYAMHIKDLLDAGNAESQVPVGEGIMPVRGVFAALMAMKYRGTVDLEYEVHPENPMPGVIASFAYMRGVLAGMGYR